MQSSRNGVLMAHKTLILCYLQTGVFLVYFLNKDFYSSKLNKFLSQVCVESCCVESCVKSRDVKKLKQKS